MSSEDEKEGVNEKKRDVARGEAVEALINQLKEEGRCYQEILKVISEGLHKAFEKDELLPISIFSNDKLSCLETIVKYLRENLELKFSEIAKILGRNAVPIGNCYRITRQKMPEIFVVKPSKFVVPGSIFQNRVLSVLENIVSYLKEQYDLAYHDIALLLRRDDRTIWTVYDRAKKKRGRK